MSKHAILEVDAEAMRRILQLPSGATIGAVLPTARVGVLLLRVDGAGWETKEGDFIRTTKAIVRQSGDRPQLIDWGF